MNENVSIILNDNDILPVGKKSWVLPESSCNKGLDEERTLLLTSCKIGQYSCDDGRCIDIVNRCDGVAHCNDLSDEKSCQLVNIDPKKYLKGKTPPSETETLPVEVSSQVWAILGIQDVGQLTNHHGTTIKPNQMEDDSTITHVQPADSVDSSHYKLDLVSRNEEVQVAALRNHYAKMKENEAKKNEKRLKLCLRFAHVYNPIAALSFVSVYWILGLKEADYF